MRYKKIIRGWTISIVMSLLLYGYFEAPNPSEKMQETIVEEESEPEVYVTGDLEVHFLDVGQADCTLIKCDGYSMLIDAGQDNQGTKIQHYLQKQGVEKLDYMVLTHPDSDHIGSVDVILTKFPVDMVLMSSFKKDSRMYEDMMKILEDNQITYFTPKVGDSYTFGSASFQIIAPNREYEDPNNSSVSLLLKHGENEFLFTGDAEETAEEDMLENGLDISADVFHAGHHGSKTSNTEEFLEKVSPRYAVISCGKDNAYGLPNEEVLSRFYEKGIEIYRTDEQGTIVATSDGKEIIWAQ